jgi:replicative DNA helicase
VTLAPESPIFASSQSAAPPHDLAAEESVLGALLLTDRVHYEYLIDIGLRPEDFYRQKHATIYESIQALYAEAEPIDVVTVGEHLKSRGELEAIGGTNTIDALTAVVPNVGNLRRYAKIVHDQALLRRVLHASYQILASVQNHEGAAEELVERAEMSILEVARDDRTKDFRRIFDVVDDETRRWERLAESGSTLTGTPSGFEKLDAITGGFQPGNMIIVAARPSMGKSALVANFAQHAAVNAKEPKPVAMFSLEMSESELAQRFVSSQAGIPGDDLRHGRLKDPSKWKRVADAANAYSQAPLYIDDSSDISMLEVRAKARRLHQQTLDEYGGLGLVIIDYLQLMRTDSRIENRVQAVGEISRGLKMLARELKVPVIALSQLSRNLESRGGPDGKVPMLSDLRESGQIEQDADLVMFIYRDDYYTKDNAENPGFADLIIAKHRNGSLGKVPLYFRGEFGRFLQREDGE